MSLSLLLLNNIKRGSKRLLVNFCILSCLKFFYNQGSVATAHEILKDNGDVDKLTKLSNGLNVASHNNGRNIATVLFILKIYIKKIFQIGVWIEAGSAFETSENNGVAMLFEHLLYTVFYIFYFKSIF